MVLRDARGNDRTHLQDASESWGNESMNKALIFLTLVLILQACINKKANAYFTLKNDKEAIKYIAIDNNLKYMYCLPFEKDRDTIIISINNAMNKISMIPNKGYLQFSNKIQIPIISYDDVIYHTNVLVTGGVMELITDSSGHVIRSIKFQ